MHCCSRCIKSKVTDVSPGHWRLQAVVISSGDSKTLLINTYFPFDRGRQAGGNIEEGFELISAIKKTVEESGCLVFNMVWGHKYRGIQDR